ncbi:MAG: hypothetical protein VKK63_08110 [Synechococcus sp.]|nr:hypothetical protein [Synechococcus sp.]
MDLLQHDVALAVKVGKKRNQDLILASYVFSFGAFVPPNWGAAPAPSQVAIDSCY